jgi:hypothetical protein
MILAYHDRRKKRLKYVKVFYSPMNAQVIVLKTVLKFTLK